MALGNTNPDHLPAAITQKLLRSGPAKTIWLIRTEKRRPHLEIAQKNKQKGDHKKGSNHQKTKKNNTVITEFQFVSTALRKAVTKNLEKTKVQAGGGEPAKMASHQKGED